MFVGFFSVKKVPAGLKVKDENVIYMTYSKYMQWAEKVILTCSNYGRICYSASFFLSFD